MATRTKAKLMTADQFFDWVMRPENQGMHYELVRGEVIEMPRPGERHGLICANAVTIIGLYARQQRKGYALSNDPGILLERNPDTVRGPDVAYFEKGKRYEEMNPKFAEGVPTLAVEVLSPNDRLGKVTRRVSEFLRAGIRLVWVIDPEACDVMVYRAGHESYVVGRDQELTGDDILPDFRCAVADFFFSPEEEPPSAEAEGGTAAPGTTSRPKRRPRGNRGR
jgi:Uma2 family endonuclease